MKNIIENIITLIVWYALLLLFWGNDWAMQLAMFIPSLFLIFWIKSILKKKFINKIGNEFTKKQNNFSWLMCPLITIVGFTVFGAFIYWNYFKSIT